MIKWCIFLYVAGLSLSCLEIFVPGGILGLVGITSIAISFWMAYSRVSPVFGSYFATIGVLTGVFFFFLSLKYLPRTRFSRRVFLGSNERAYKSSDDEFVSMEGKEGVALTKLRPSGIARVEGKRIYVVSEGVFIDSEEKVKVIKVKGNRILVRRIAPSVNGQG